MNNVTIFFALATCAVYAAVKIIQHYQPRMICTSCHSVGRPVPVSKGSVFLEIGLYFLLILPGILYSLWRFADKEYVCERCGGKRLVPLDSPVGKKIIALNSN